MIRTFKKQILGKEITLIESDGFLHLKGNPDYPEMHGCPLADGKTADDYEELDALPAYTKAEYDAKVEELIRARYTASEVEGIYRKVLSGDEKAKGELEVFNAYAEQCKAEAKNPELYKIERD